jgi:hypothetical protein
VEAYAPETPAEPFAPAREHFDRLIGWLSGSVAAGSTHADVEAWVGTDGREVLLKLYQGFLDLQALREQRLTGVADADGVLRSRVETDRERGLAAVFGEVRVRRMAYRQPGHADLHPADAALNLPVEKYSHGLRRLAAIESTRGSYADTVDAIERATGQRLGNRQVEQLAGRAVVDFDAFYADRCIQPSLAGAALMLSFDGKGVVMRPDGLRPATAKAARTARRKLATRLSKGEKRNRKRMAEVAAVYDAVPEPRTPSDILADPGSDRPRAAGPKAANKWLTASVVADAADVIAAGFAEADRRDPSHERTWVALVDGNAHQIDRIRAEADARDVPVTIVVDFVHVIEYVWKAAWCFYQEGDPAAETWVREQGLRILAGRSHDTAAAIRRKATYHGLDPCGRAAADTCADYLTRLRSYLDYATALEQGWPIATGVIEGACRHLVKDRMDITGARWGLDGAEAILKLRALRSNGDFDAYWTFHLAQEHQRIHASRYLNGFVPAA